MPNEARPLMVQGTSSHAGKSVITASLCRMLRKRNIRVAPFKAQNMALNSFVTREGLEIGRAQAFQAEAAGIEPSVDMNPVLLKPTADKTCQVIVHGRAVGNMSAAGYHAFKKEVRRFVMESYSRLARAYEVIIIEGAGSPAEVNLRENDIANMGVAELARSPVVIVGDIDRGGVFASIVGTMELLMEDERRWVKGFLINKFRGDAGLLKPGVDFLEERTGVPVLGVIPYMEGLILPDEDGVAVEGNGRGKRGPWEGIEQVHIAVIRLPRISNFTDFDPFRYERGVELSFASDPGDIKGADLVIIPGSKNTIEDLWWLRCKGFARAIESHIEGGGMLAGICGGFQMLGSRVRDPMGIESSRGEMEGLGFLEMETELMSEKSTYQVEALSEGLFGRTFRIEGYEIHMGVTRGRLSPLAVIRERNGRAARAEDGAVTGDGSIWGTYIHGIFDNDNFRRALIEELGRRRGLAQEGGRVGFREMMEASMERLSRTVEENVDTGRLFEIMELEDGRLGESSVR